MTREEKAIKALKWFKAYNEEDYCGGDRIQDEHGDWYYRITEQDFEAFDTAIKALEQEPTTKKDLGVDCISRADLYNEIKGIDHYEETEGNESDGSQIIYQTCDWNEVLREIEDAPSVTPQEPKPMVEIDLYSVIKQKYIEREVLDKILKEIADLKAKDVMKELNRERTTAFEWTKHDIYRIVEKAKAEEGEE